MVRRCGSTLIKELVFTWSAPAATSSPGIIDDAYPCLLRGARKGHLCTGGMAVSAARSILRCACIHCGVMQGGGHGGVACLR